MSDDEYESLTGTPQIMFACKECGAIVQSEWRERHSDWHFHLDDSIDHAMKGGDEWLS